MFASFNRIDLSIRLADARSASHQGDCEADVRTLLAEPYISRQFDAINPDAIRTELGEYGAWNATELADDEMNRVRILWLACGNLDEEATTIIGHMNDDFMTPEFVYYESAPDDGDDDAISGWWCRLSAPGYLDCTDWHGPFDTEDDAIEYLIDTYFDDWENL
jgi:hypothetical protein